MVKTKHNIVIDFANAEDALNAAVISEYLNRTSIDPGAYILDSIAFIDDKKDRLSTKDECALANILETKYMFEKFGFKSYDEIKTYLEDVMDPQVCFVVHPEKIEVAFSARNEDEERILAGLENMTESERAGKVIEAIVGYEVYSKHGTEYLDFVCAATMSSLFLDLHLEKDESILKAANRLAESPITMEYSDGLLSSINNRSLDSIITDFKVMKGSY